MNRQSPTMLQMRIYQAVMDSMKCTRTRTPGRDDDADESSAAAANPFAAAER